MSITTAPDMSSATRVLVASDDVGVDKFVIRARTH